MLGVLRVNYLIDCGIKLNWDDSLLNNEKYFVVYKLAENEEEISVLYQEYAKRFPDYQSFWLGLANDEKEHAGWIRSLYEKTDESTLVLNLKNFNKDAIQTYLNYLQRELVKAKQGEATLLGAFTTTLYIEESLIESKFYDVFETNNFEVQQILNDLTTSMKLHLTKAKEAFNNYKGKSSRNK